MRVRGGDHIRPGHVQAGVDGECGLIDGAVAFNDFPTLIDQHQVGDADMAEVHTKGIHPEMVLEFGIAGSDVAGDTFAETEFREQAKGRGQPLLAMEALFRGGGECGWFRRFSDFHFGGLSGAGHGNGLQ